MARSRALRPAETVSSVSLRDKANQLYECAYSTTTCPGCCSGEGSLCGVFDLGAQVGAQGSGEEDPFLLDLVARDVYGMGIRF